MIAQPQLIKVAKVRLRIRIFVAQMIQLPYNSRVIVKGDVFVVMIVQRIGFTLNYTANITSAQRKTTSRLPTTK